MSYVERHTVEVTTATGGGATAFTPVVQGRLTNVIYTAATGDAVFASTDDFTITSEESGHGIWTESNVTASKTVSPAQALHSTSGVAFETAGDVQAGPVFVAHERISIVVAQGGNTKSGTFVVVVA